MVRFRYKPITNANNFGGRRAKSEIKFIAIHWTSNTSKTATAENHYKYFQNNNVGASAHYFVDDDEIVQIVGDTTIAYAVGGNQGYGVALNGCTNRNSISIEMCVNRGYSEKMLFNTIELVKELLRLYPDAKVCRHWDATRKNCPQGFTGNSDRWANFLSEIKKPRRLILDLSKDSIAKEAGGNTVNKPQCVMYEKDGNRAVAETIANIKHIKCFKDNGKDLPNSEHEKWEILYIGDLGKDRGETAKIALNRFLNANIK